MTFHPTNNLELDIKQESYNSGGIVGSLPKKPSEYKKIGVFPGSFNPLHDGHWDAALRAITECDLELVLFYVNSFNLNKVSNLRPIHTRIASIAKKAKDTPAIQVISLEFYSDKPDVAELSQATVFLPLLNKLDGVYFNAKIYLIRGSDYFKSDNGISSYPEVLRAYPHIIGLRDNESLGYDYSFLPKSSKIFKTFTESSTRLRSEALKNISEVYNPLDLKSALMGILLRKFESHLSDSKFVFLIAGPGAVGKTTFCKELVYYLNNEGYSSTIFQIDNFLIPRKNRKTGADGLELTGYNPEAYELNDACNKIEKILSNEDVEVYPYNMSESNKGAPETLNSKARIIIIDGSMALMPIIRKYGCFGVFLEANNDVLYRNRYIRETEFGFSKTEIDAKFIRLMEYDYKFFIQPQIHFADLVITVESDYRFSSIKSQITNSVLPE